EGAGAPAVAARDDGRPAPPADAVDHRAGGPGPRADRSGDLAGGLPGVNPPVRVTDSYKTAAVPRAYGRGMTPRLDAISIITADLAASLAFYRRLGLDIPDGAESAPHVEVTLPGGQRLLW